MQKEKDPCLHENGSSILGTERHYLKRIVMADRPLFVVVLPLTANTKLHAEDASAVGVYEVMADTSTGDVLSAASALESFHIRTPISFPENFVIKVVDPHSKQVLDPGQPGGRTLAMPCRKISSVVRGWLSDLVDAPATTAPAIDQTKKGTLLVVVEEVKGAVVHADDMGIAGVYEVTGIDPSMTDMEKAESALETFHGSNGIAVLENYEISVIDPVSRKIMDTGEDCEFAEFDCEKLSEEIPDWIDKLLNSPAAVRCEDDEPSPGF
jgi:hypothetical protein